MAHAPHSGIPMATRQAWWISTSDILKNFLASNTPLLVCLDANASPGEPEGAYVCLPGFSTSSGTSFLRSFQQDWYLYAPITSVVHEGTTCTWTSPNDTEHTIDYVLIPIIWAHSCSMSRVVEEFDLGNLSLDHSVVAIELKRQQTGTYFTGPHRPADSFDRSSIAHQLRHSLKVGQVAEWTTDVEQHLQGVKTTTCSLMPATWQRSGQALYQ